jgi:hypothetical protein
MAAKRRKRQNKGFGPGCPLEQKATKVTKPGKKLRFLLLKIRAFISAFFAPPRLCVELPLVAAPPCCAFWRQLNFGF